MEMANGSEVQTGGGDTADVKISVIARQLPKGTFVKLRPLEAGYDTEDWKALLEQHLRNNYTTLTKGDVLVVPGGGTIGSADEHFRFLVDEFKPEGDGITVIDTDLEVAIEALNEEQARETVKRLAAKNGNAGSSTGSSAGGSIDLFATVEGQVLDGEYVDYELSSWDRSQGIEIDLAALDDDAELDLFVSLFGPRQRAKPRNNQYVFAQTESSYPRRLRILPSNIELERSESIRISIYSYPSSVTTASPPRGFTLSINPYDPNSAPQNGQEPDILHKPDEVQCKNCRQWIPKRTLMLHENFCYRNNILCPKGCDQVFQKASPEWKTHWHCPFDQAFGNTPLSESKHNAYNHTQTTCPGCSRTYSSLSTLAHHRTTICPAKLILCQFCHLQVPQEGDPDSPDPIAMLTGLTVHEQADGGRTTDCHLCGRLVRLRDMRAHLAHHDLSKSTRPAPRICANKLCGSTRDGTALNGDTRVHRITDGDDEHLDLCPKCFGPLYVALHDPEGKALRRRIERRYLTQMVTGCSKPWCANTFCQTGRLHQSLPPQGKNLREALPLVKPIVDALAASAANGGYDVPLDFCVDEASQRNRTVAEMVSAGGVYGLEWCVGAVEAAQGDLGKANEWLVNWAPKKQV